MEAVGCICVFVVAFAAVVIVFSAVELEFVEVAMVVFAVFAEFAEEFMVVAIVFDVPVEFVEVLTFGGRLSVVLVELLIVLTDVVLVELKGIEFAVLV